MSRTALALLLSSFVWTPAGAQEIMSYEAYQRFQHEEPYVLRLCANSGPGELLYFGSRHSNDTADPQMARIEDVFRSFKPDSVLTEGGDLDIAGLGKSEAIARYGEFGLARWLALGSGIAAGNLDPPRAAEVAYLRGAAGFTTAELKVFYTLRQVSQSQRTERKIDFTQAVPRYLQHLSTARDLPGPPETLSEFEEAVRRLLPDLANWQHVSPQLFYPGPQNPHQYTNDVQTASNNFRDRYHIRRLTKAVDSGRRVFAIVGSAHVVMQESALRNRLRSENCR